MKQRELNLEWTWKSLKISEKCGSVEASKCTCSHNPVLIELSLNEAKDLALFIVEGMARCVKWDLPFTEK